MRHDESPNCPRCEAKLATADPRLAEWFKRVKARYPNVHVSWAYRNAEEQEQAFADKRTKLHYPDSPHNHMEEGKPCALALDLFLIDEDGIARFPGLFYAKLNAENERDREKIEWGGRWKNFGDLDHFQIQASRNDVEPNKQGE